MIARSISDHGAMPLPMRKRRARGLRVRGGKAFLFLLLLCLLFQPSEALASKKITKSIKTVNAKIEAVDELVPGDQETRDQLLKKYRQALDELENAREWYARNEEFTDTLKNGRAKLQALETERQTLAAAPPEVLDSNLNQADLIQLQAQLSGEQADLNRRAAELAEGLDKRAERQVKIFNLANEAKNKIEKLNKKLEGFARGEPLAPAAEAELLLLEARKTAAEYELKSYDLELESADIRALLNTAEAELITGKIAHLETRLNTVNEWIDQRNKQEAEREFQLALEAIAANQSHPSILSQLARDTADLASQRTGHDSPLEKAGALETDILKITRRLEKRRSQFLDIQNKAKTSGLIKTLGIVLRKYQAGLPDSESLERDLKTHRQEIAQLQMHLMDLDDQRAQLREVDQLVEQELAAFSEEAGGISKTEFEKTLRELLSAKRRALSRLISDLNTYHQNLVDYNLAVGEYLKLVRDFEKFIATRIFWVRSTNPLQATDLDRSLAAWTWLVDDSSWKQLRLNLGENFRGRLLLNVAILGVLIFLLLFRNPLSNRILESTRPAHPADPSSMRQLFLAIAAALLAALPMPLLLLTCAWWLELNWEAPEFTRAFAVACRITALFFFTIAFHKQICRKGGVGEIHFKWHVPTCRRLSCHFRWIELTAIPLLFLLCVLEAQGIEARKDSLGRLLFIAVNLLLVAFLYLPFRTSQPVLRDLVNLDKTKPVPRFVYFLWSIFFLMPAALAILSFLGYYYTARQLAWRLFVSWWLAAALIAGKEIFIQWLLHTRRRLAEKEKKETASENAEDEEIVPADHPFVGLSPEVASEQSRKILQLVLLILSLVGVAIIWASVLPALGFLDQLELWSTTEKVTEAIAGADGGVVHTQMIERQVPITLLDFLLAVIGLTLTFIVGRNFPGFFEITVLKRLELDKGVQYAIANLSKYLINIVGVIVVFNILGLSWSKIQWLAAAITVGLGFGLQEIFANFVSGIIILFERPLRVGDTVTIGEIEGTVSRIQMRATTVRSWDRRELVIPNKEFITGRLINWTLTDKLLRIVIRFRVAYGTDTDQLRKLCKEVVASLPAILPKPKTKYLLIKLDHDSLLYEIRTYVEGIKNYREVRHLMNTRIHRTLRRNGIRFAFPQMDVHFPETHPLDKPADPPPSETAAAKPAPEIKEPQPEKPKPPKEKKSTSRSDSEEG